MADLERELLYRILHARPPGFPNDVSLLVGQLPPDFPFALPEGSRVLGTQLYEPAVVPRGGMNRVRSANVHLDSPLSAQAFVAAVQATLRDRGWEELRGEGPPRAGFVNAQQHDSLHYADPATELGVQVQAHEEGGVTRVNVNVMHFSPEHRDHLRRMADHERGVPVLEAPEDVTVHFGGSGGGAGGTAYKAVFETNATAADLHAHFVSQLERQGGARLLTTQEAGPEASLWQGAEGQLVFLTLTARDTGWVTGHLVVTGLDDLRDTWGRQPLRRA